VPRGGVRPVARRVAYLLVHGAYRGGWSWDRLAPLLEAEGHVVLRPTLAGQGDRRSELAPGIGLRSHVHEIAALLASRAADEVVLAGHSYGGMVISGAAHALPDRVRHLVYVDAPVPGDGQSLFDLLAPERRAELAALARDRGEGLSIPVTERLSTVADPDDARWIRERLTPQPLAAFTEPVSLRSERAAALPGTFIRCTATEGIPSPISRSGDRVRHDPRWRYHEIAAPHDVMVTAPRALADILLALA
jgi:pimeloyl-ACP methyl ester carboxylesterase